MSTLKVEALTVRLPPGADRAEAAADVSFELKREEILCLVGESGSGKSVIAQTVMGLLPSTLRVSAGKIFLEGEELLSASESDCASCAARAWRWSSRSR